eukprot:Gb_00261 [translate_table: standard]
MASGSYDRVDFYRKNRDYARLLDEDGVLEDVEEEEEEDESRQYRKSEPVEDPEVTRDRQEYLERRQKLKELERQKLKQKFGGVYGRKNGASKNESGNQNGRSEQSISEKGKKKTLPYDNYGSFFGPSQPVVARRVIEETRARLEAAHIAAKVAAKVSKEAPEVKKVSTTTSDTNPEYKEPPKVVNETKKKAQQLKAARDYSFLLSENADISVPERSSAPASESRSIAPPRPDNGRPKQVIAKNSMPLKKPVVSSKPVTSSKEAKGMVSSNRQMPTKVGMQKVSPNTSAKTAFDPKRQLSKVASGPGRPIQENGSMRYSGNSVTKVVSADGDKKRVPIMSGSKFGKDEHQRPSISRPTTMQKTPPLKAPVPKPQAEQRKPPALPRSAPKPVPKLAPKPAQKPAPKPLSKQPMKPHVRPAKPPISRDLHHERPKKRPRDADSDDDVGGEDYRSVIRQMFRYDPNKYRDIDDQDDSDMEVGFSSIQAEERRSARIAREEDERELELIEAEERAERARAKKRKLKQNQR